MEFIILFSLKRKIINSDFETQFIDKTGNRKCLENMLNFSLLNCKNEYMNEWHNF